MKASIIRVLIAYVFYILFSLSCFGQGNVGIGTNNPSQNAILDIQSNSKGVLIPRLDSLERISILNPENGLLIYENNSESFWMFDGLIWKPIQEDFKILSRETNSSVYLNDNIQNGYYAGIKLDNIVRFIFVQNEHNVPRLEFRGIDDNVLIGNFAGANMDPDSNFQFITGKQNVFIGKSTGYTNLKGALNTSIGAYTHINNDNGNENTHIGSYSAVTGKGDKNVSLGSFSAYDNLSGDENTCIGHSAGLRNLGDGNVFLGFSAGAFELGSNKLYIDNSPTVSPLLYGNFSADSLIVNGSLSINSAFCFPTIDGSSNQILQTDGNGHLGWIDIETSMLKDDDGNTLIDVEKTSNDDHIRFQIAGSEELEFSKNIHGELLIQNSSTNDNVFFGRNAGVNTNGSTSTGIGNTFIGGLSGRDNISGETNTFLGSNTGILNTSGSSNVFVGFSGGLNNLTGTNNCALGSSSLKSNQDGNDNVALGHLSLQNNVSGDSNIGIGFAALDNNIMGSNNIAIGHGAGFSETGSFKLHIESLSPSNPLIYGDFLNRTFTINGNQGMNIDIPLTDFHIKQQTSNTAIRLEFSTNTNYWDTYVDAAQDYNFSFNNTLKAYINDSDGSYNTPSDVKLKEGVESIKNVLPHFLTLKPKLYSYIADPSHKEQIGLIAQEVETIFPQAVSEKDGYKSVNYAVFGVLAIQAIKEQQELINRQENRIQELEKQMEQVLLLLNK